MIYLLLISYGWGWVAIDNADVINKLIVAMSANGTLHNSQKEETIQGLSTQLLEVGPDVRTVVPALIDCLKSQPLKEDTADDICDLLSAIGIDAIPELLREIESRSNVAHFAIKAIAKISPGRYGSRITASLSRASMDPTVSIQSRVAACEALYEIDSEFLLIRFGIKLCLQYINANFKEGEPGLGTQLERLYRLLENLSDGDINCEICTDEVLAFVQRPTDGHRFLWTIPRFANKSLKGKSILQTWLRDSANAQTRGVHLEHVLDFYQRMRVRMPDDEKILMGVMSDKTLNANLRVYASLCLRELCPSTIDDSSVIQLCKELTAGDEELLIQVCLRLLDLDSNCSVAIDEIKSAKLTSSRIDDIAGCFLKSENFSTQRCEILERCLRRDGQSAALVVCAIKSAKSYPGLDRAVFWQLTSKAGNHRFLNVLAENMPADEVARNLRKYDPSKISYFIKTINEEWRNKISVTGRDAAVVCAFGSDAFTYCGSANPLQTCLAIGMARTATDAGIAQIEVSSRSARHLERRYAAWALGRLEHRQDADRILNMLANDPNAAVRTEAIRGIGRKSSNPNWDRLLFNALLDHSESVSDAARQAIETRMDSLRSKSAK